MASGQTATDGGTGADGSKGPATNEPRLCQTVGCRKPASLQCPTCVKKGLEASWFCGQECFKDWFSVHKQLHVPGPRQMIPTWARSFRFSGPLRPGLFSKRRTVPDDIARPDYAETGFPESERSGPLVGKGEVHDAAGIAKMRKVGKLARECLDAGALVIAPGVTTDDIDAAVHAAAIERKCYPSPLNYHGFPKSCCTSVNEVICHGIPDSTILKEGDLVNIDVTVYHDGYHGDLNETYFVGTVDAKSRKLAKSAYECMMAAVNTVKPGAKVADFGAIIPKTAKANGHSVVRSYTGHGIGQLFHGFPTVYHYNKPNARGVCKPGLTFTIEPMINLGNPGDIQWPDNWTAVTADGKRSAQFEHTLLVTETGVEILTARLPTSPPLFLDEALSAECIAAYGPM